MCRERERERERKSERWKVCVLCKEIERGKECVLK